MIDKASQFEDQLVSAGKGFMSLRRDLEKARSESRTDPLTGLPNRKAFNAYLEAQTARALADRKPLTLCFLDIDHFKNFNYRWGHALGDEVLRSEERRVGKARDSTSRSRWSPYHYKNNQ